MTLVVTHAKVTSGTVDNDVEVDLQDWNDNHTLTGVISPAQGGTGVVNNDASTITVSGAFGTTFTVTGTTNVTLPTTGTLATTSNNASLGLTSSGEVTFAAASATQGPFKIEAEPQAGINPHMYMGYNIALPGATLVNPLDKGLALGLEANWDPGTGPLMEFYLQYQISNGFTGDASRRPIMIVIDKTTNLPTLSTIGGGTLGVDLTIFDGAGTEQQKTTGKVKANLTQNSFRVYNQPGGTTDALYIDSSAASVGNGLSIRNTAATGGVHLKAVGTSVNEALYLDGQGAGGPTVLNSDSGGPVLFPDGNQSAPGLGFTNDQDTGIWRSAADTVNVATGGVNVVQIRQTAGAAGLDIQSQSAGNGIHLAALSSGANDGFYIDAKGSGPIVLQSATTGPVLFPDGSVGAPAFSFTNDQNTGIYRVGADTMGLAANGVKRLEVNTAGIAVTGTVNKVTITAPATGSTLTIADGKTATINNTLTFTGTDGATVPFGTRTRQTFTSGTSATYTTPANVKYIVVRLVGGGGGGGGGGAVGTKTDGTAGNNTTFSTFTAGGGGQGLATGPGGAGGTASGGGLNASGNAGLLESTLGTGAVGGQGAGSVFAGGGVGGSLGGAGGAGGTNTGGGGGGGGSTSSATTGAGGGGSGGYVEAIITSPAATYTYTVGGTAAGGAAGTSGGAGGAGAAGIIIVDEFYQ